MRALKLLPFLVLLLVGVSCDSIDNPIAPSGSVLNITASPTQIGLTGDGSTITVSGFKPDGNPLNPGTQLQLSTDIGALRPAGGGGCGSGQTIARLDVDTSGQATALLCGNGQTGAATVTARLVNSAEGEATVGVQIGSDATTQPSIVISANPTIVATLDTSTITILARAVDGSPLGAGERIRLTSDLGSLRCPVSNCPGESSNPCSAVCTNGVGEATATYVAGDRSGTGTVSAIVGTSEEQTVNITINAALDSLSLTVAPQSITRSDAGVQVTLTAVLLDPVGTPLNNVLVRFDSQAGSLDNAVAQTNTQGQAIATLTVRDVDVQNIQQNGTFTVTATATSEGETRSDTKSITVLGSP